mmetsp:Transcript_21377/g.32681  ORF Transcript_21377/g.32681 Transcript_21377/m.32681 type:complete len:149 (-) Transcript_21377:12-458(-)
MNDITTAETKIFGFLESISGSCCVLLSESSADISKANAKFISDLLLSIMNLKLYSERTMKVLYDLQDCAHKPSKYKRFIEAKVRDINKINSKQSNVRTGTETQQVSNYVLSTAHEIQLIKLYKDNHRTLNLHFLQLLLKCVSYIIIFK